MKLLPIMPSYVGVFRFNRELSADEIDCMGGLARRQNQFNEISFENQILEYPAMGDLKAFMQESLKDYLKACYDPEHDVDLRIIQSWVNWTLNGAHHIHTHPNSFLSGVFYVQTGSHDNITFSDLNRTSGIRIESKKGGGALFKEKQEVGVESSYLLIFPSNLWHEVTHREGETERVSLSFNTFPVGKIFGYHSKMGLEL